MFQAATHSWISTHPVLNKQGAKMFSLNGKTGQFILHGKEIGTNIVVKVLDSFEETIIRHHKLTERYESLVRMTCSLYLPEFDILTSFLPCSVSLINTSNQLVAKKSYQLLKSTEEHSGKYTWFSAKVCSVPSSKHNSELIAEADLRLETLLQLVKKSTWDYSPVAAELEELMAARKDLITKYLRKSFKLNKKIRELKAAK